MFNKSKPEITGNYTYNTVIGEGITIESTKITGSGSIQIDGSLIGEVDINGNLIIGETGHVKGDIRIKHVIIAGKMNGNVYCREGIHLTSTADLNGNIETDTLVIDEGARFTGTSFMNTNSKGIWEPNFKDDEESDIISDEEPKPISDGERSLLQRIRSETY